MPSRVLGVQPIPADQHQHQITGGEPFLENLPEITARGDAVYIHEHGLAAEQIGQVIAQGPGVTRIQVSSIADEDVFHQIQSDLEVIKG